MGVLTTQGSIRLGDRWEDRTHNLNLVILDLKNDATLYTDTVLNFVGH